MLLLETFLINQPARSAGEGFVNFDFLLFRLKRLDFSLKLQNCGNFF